MKFFRNIIEKIKFWELCNETFNKERYGLFDDKDIEKIEKQLHIHESQWRERNK